MSQKQVILIVENTTQTSDCSIENINPNIEIVCVNTIGKAEDVFLNHLAGEITILLLITDACIQGNQKPNTTALIRAAKDDGFTGPIIAISPIENFRNTMKEAGCTYTTSTKTEAKLIAAELLKKDIS